MSSSVFLLPLLSISVAIFQLKHQTYLSSIYVVFCPLLCLPPCKVLLYCPATDRKMCSGRVFHLAVFQFLPNFSQWGMTFVKYACPGEQTSGWLLCVTCIHLSSLKGTVPFFIRIYVVLSWTIWKWEAVTGQWYFGLSFPAINWWHVEHIMK